MYQSQINRVPTLPSSSRIGGRLRGAMLASGVSLLALSASLAGNSAFAAGATPSGGQFAAGAGAIAATANGLAITQSTSHGVINWQSFSIGQGNTVSIANGAGATLNRVTGGDISSIAGSLTSTGSVYVINPAGVVVMPTGQVVTTGSFVASTRDISDGAFMAGGAQNFKGTSAGTVVNQGSITSSNGDVILIGKSVTNSGQISASNGTAGLVAADDVVLQPSAGSTILVNAGTGDVTNSGTIAAAQAELNAAGGNVYALATNNGGVIRATGSTTKDGHVYLTGGGNVTVDGAVSATNADGSGGAVTATAGAAGGTLSVTGTVNAGATGASAKGGKVTLTANTVNIGGTAKISADGGADGGTVFIGGDRHGGTDPTVALSATPIANAQYTTVSAGARISANGGAGGGIGNGGNVIVWSDQSTSFGGTITAQGGALAGNGGFVEVSGKQTLSFTGTVDTSAPFGVTGTLLLDPSDVTIISSTDTSGATIPGSGTPTNETVTTGTYTPSGTGNTASPGNNSSYILNTDISTALASSNVVINTGTTTDGNTGSGNIHIGTNGGNNGSNSAPIYWSTSNSLTLNAVGTIDTFGGAPTSSTGGNNPGAPTILINALGTGSITMNAASGGATGTVITVSANILTHGGNVTLASQSAGNNIVDSGNITAASPGLVTLQADVVRLGAGHNYIGSVNTTGNVSVIPFTAGPVLVGNNNNGGGAAAQPDDDPANTALINNDTIKKITANTLIIGSTSVTDLTIGSPTGISLTQNPNGTAYQGILATSVTNLEFLTGATGSVSQDARTPVAVSAGFNGGLAVVTGGAVSLPNFANGVGTLAINAGGNVVFQGNSTDTNTGTLSITTINGVSGISAPGKTVTLLNVGSTTQDPASANAITASSLVLEGGAQGNYTSNYAYNGNVVNTYTVQQYTGTFNGSYTLNNLSNSISNIAGSVSSLSLTNNAALTVASAVSDNLAAATTGSGNALTSTSFSGITSSAATAGTGAITIVDNGLLTIANGAPITTSAGNVLLEDQTFTNSNGTAAFAVTGAGNYWRVYSQDPRSDNDGTLTGANYAFVQYAAANAYGDPAAAGTFTNANGVLTAAGNYGNGTGNGFLYTVSPTVTESVSNAFTKVYDTNRNYIGDGSASETLTYNAQVVKLGATTVTNLGAGGTADTVTLNKPASMALPQSNFYSSANVGAYPLTTLPGVTLTLASAVDKNNVTVYGYTVNPNVSGTANITPAPASVTASNQSRVYGPTGGTLTLGALQTTQFTVSGLLAGASVSSVTLTGSTAATAATTNTGTLVGAITPSTAAGTGLSNYTITYNPGNVTITAAPLTLTPVAVSTQYNATTLNNTTYSDTLTNYTISGYQNGDTAVSVSLALNGSMAFNGSTATAVKNATTYTQAVGTLGLTSTNSNYSLNFTNPVPNNYVITPAPVTIVGSKAFDNNTTADSSTFTTPISTGSGVFASDSANVGITGSGTLGSANAGSYSTTNGTAAVMNGITLNTLALNGTAATNYNLVGANYTVTAANLTLAGGTKVYNGNTVVLASSINSLSNLQPGDSLGGDLTLSGTGSTTLANVGSYTGTGATFLLGTLTLGGSAAANYTLGAGTYTITAAPLTVTASNQSRVYGPTGGTLVLGAAQTTQFTTTGTLYGADSVTSATLTGTVASTAATTNVGTLTGAITPSAAGGTGLGNYNISYVAGNVTITGAPLTVTGTKVYDTNTGFTTVKLGVTGGVNGETVSLTGGSGTSTSPNVGTYAGSTLTGLTDSVSGGNALASNYILPATGALTITPAPATVTASNQSRVYGPTGGTLVLGAAQTTQYTTSGLLAGASVNSVTLTGTGASTAATTGVGTLTGAITPSAAVGTGLSNYTLSYAAGNVTITGAPLTITAGNQSRVYGPTGGTLVLGAGQTTNYTSTPLVNGETIGSVTLTGSAASTAATTNAGTLVGAITPSAATGGTFTAANYIITYNPGNVTITAAPLTFTPVAVSVAYNATTLNNTTYSDTLTNYTISGYQNGDTAVSVSLALNGSMAFNGSTGTAVKNAATYTQAAGTLGLTSTNSNYSLNFTNPVPNNYVITKAPVTVVGSKTFDGNTTAASGTFTTPISVGSGVFASDSANVGITGSATLGSANAASYSTTNGNATVINGITLNTLALNGTAAGNYNLVGANYTVTTATLTLGSGGRAYDGTTTAPASTITSLSNLAPGDALGGDLTLTGAGSITSANVGSYTGGGATFSLGTLTLGGAAATNYTLGAGTYTVSGAPVTVTASNQSRVYGPTGGTLVLGAAQTTQFTTSGTFYGGDSITSATLAGSAASTAATTGVGTLTGAITPSAAAGTGLSNYAITYAPGSVTITGAPLTITANNTSKVYGNIVTFTGTEFTSAGLVNGETVGSATLSSTGAPAPAPVSGSPYSIVVSAATGGTFSPANYSISYVPGVLTVTPAPAITITASPQSKTYGTVAALGTTAFTTAGLVAGDTVGGVTLTSTGAPAPSPVAAYPIVPSNETGGTFNPANYAGINYVNGVLTVNPATLLVSANPQTKVYGTNDPTLTYTETGLVNGDPDPVTGTQTRNPGETVLGGPYAITQGTLTSGNGNYTISYTGNNLTITPAPLTITGTKVYDSTTAAAAATFGALTPQLAAGDSGNVTLTGNGTLGGVNVGGYSSANSGGAGLPLTGFSLTGSAASNYAIALANYTVTPEPITITAVPTTKVYDGTPTSPGTPVVTTGVIYGPDTGIFTQIYNTPNVGTGLTLTPTGTIVGTPGNYTVTYAPVFTGIITPAPLTVSGTRVYDGLPDAPGSILTTIIGEIPGDPALTVTGTGSLANKNVNTTPTPIVTFGTLALTGTGSGNYVIASGTVKVTPAPLVISAVNTTKVYDGGVASVGIPTYSGLLTGDTISTLSQTYVSRNVLGLNGSTLTVSPGYTITDANGGGNYAVTVKTSPGTITPEPLIVTAAPTTKPYDGTPISPNSPIVTAGVVYGPDVGKFIQTYGSVNVGTGLTLTPSGAVSDGNGGNNYTITFVPAAVGTITATAPDVPLTFNQTTAGVGDAPGDFTIYNGGILYVKPSQNGIVTGTIATIDGQDYQSDTQLGCTLGASGACLQNGVNSAGATTNATANPVGVTEIAN